MHVCAYTRDFRVCVRDKVACAARMVKAAKSPLSCAKPRSSFANVFRLTFIKLTYNNSVLLNAYHGKFFFLDKSNSDNFEIT